MQSVTTHWLKWSKEKLNRFVAMAIRITSVESYVVRIYRRERGQGLVGVVEFPTCEKQVVFRSFEELRAILGQQPGTTLSTQE